MKSPTPLYLVTHDSLKVGPFTPRLFKDRKKAINAALATADEFKGKGRSVARIDAPDVFTAQYGEDAMVTVTTVNLE